MPSLAPDLITLTDDHRYVHADGHVVPSVTDILRKSGLRRPLPWYRRDDPRRQSVKAALQRGADVHRLCRAVDETGDYTDAVDDDFDPANPTAETVNYVAGYSDFLATSGFEPIAWEKILYCRHPEFAGKCDAVGWLGSRRVLIDRKTDRSLNKSVYVQLAGYRRAWDLMHPDEPIDATYALQLKPDMTWALLRNPIEDEGWSYFVAAWWLHRWHTQVV